MDKTSLPRAAYRPLVEACAEYGIRRTRAFQLARDGLLDVFKIGRRTFCFTESLEQLPARLKREGHQ